MPGAHQIRTDVLAAAHKITQLLMLDSRDGHECQLASGEQPGKTDRVALVGLDPIAGTAIGSRRGADRDFQHCRASAAHETVAGRSCLINHPRGTWDPLEPWQQLVRSPDHASRRELAGVLVKDSDRALVRVHVKTDPPNTVSHVGTSS
jgi:hypothetical protein